MESNLAAKITKFSRLRRPFLFAIDFSGKEGFVLTPEEAAERGIRWEMEGGIGTGDQAVKRSVGRFEMVPVEFEKYRDAFNQVQHHLHRGDSYLLNLTFPTRIETEATLEQIFEMSVAQYKLLVPGHFVVFSPELFIRINGPNIISCPMKGTIDAAIPGAVEILLSDRKERFEHNTIVDLIRNDLAMVSTEVTVTRFRYIDRLSTNRGDLLQMSSEIRGTLPCDWHDRLGEIIFTLLPAGSVTGAPKEKTVEIIRAAEQYERGFYTGIFGYYDGIALTTAVSIRFIELTSSGLVFKSGGGITTLSDPVKEYEEMIRKVYVPVV